MEYTAKSKLDLMYKKEQEEELKKKYGEKETTPNVKIMMGKNEEKMKALTGDPNFGSTVKNALVKSATLQAQNQTMLAQNTTKNVMNVAQNYGAANASYGNAYNKYAQNVGETTKNTVDHWANANAANSGANLQMGKQLESAASQTAQKYGNIWGMTTGVTGSDQTGASIWGYRNAGDHKVNQGDYQQSVEKIRGQIADGGVDGLGHAIAARGLSGGKTLDSYNKILEYSATGKISDDHTVTPGVYSKIVDEAVADYLTKQYGSKAGNIYNKATEIFDDVASVGLGTGLGIVKSAIDTAGESLDRARWNGANDQQAVTHGFGAGLSNAAGNLFAEGVKKIDIPMTNEAKKQLAKLPESVKKPLADGMNAGAAALVEDITKEMLNKGFSRKQAVRVLNYELRKLQDYGQEISVGALQSIAGKLLK